MSAPSEILVVGAGVLGACTAAELARRGHAPTVIDPGGANASSVAAGMIAPALECLLDAAGPERAALFRAALDLWPAFADAIGVELFAEGADWLDPDAEGAAARLRALGFSARSIPGGLHAADDRRVDPPAALAALSRFKGVCTIRDEAIGAAWGDGRWTVEGRAGRWSAPTLVLATGVAPALDGLPRPAAVLVSSVAPIRGQLTRVAGARLTRVVRADGAYAAPSGADALVGATMEPGRRDLTPDPDAPYLGTGLAQDVIRAAPYPRTLEHRVGIRGATEDGLPMAGVAAPGLHLALAPRRNGWLLGPLAARVVVDGIEGRPPGPFAAALDPGRFSGPRAG